MTSQLSDHRTGWTTSLPLERDNIHLSYRQMSTRALIIIWRLMLVSGHIRADTCDLRT